MFPVKRALSLSALIAAGLSATVYAQSAAPASPPAAQQKPTDASQVADTSSPHQIQLDDKHRVITAGGFVKTGPVVFEDISEKSGLARWTYKMGTPAKDYIIETKGSGVGLIDYDNDGWLDIYLVNGSTVDALSGKEAAPQAALFHNNHDGTFTNVAAKAGVTNDRWGFGVAIADYDNDGWPDIFVSNFGNNRLYHNNHDGTFTDLAEKAGVTLGNWSSGPTWGDYDGDGRLDLFVAGYVHSDWQQSSGQGRRRRLHQLLLHVSRRGYAADRADSRATRSSLPQQWRRHLYRRQRESRRSRQARLLRTRRSIRRHQQRRQTRSPRGNDSTPNYLYINKGDGTFEDVSYASGYALNEAGRETASMGSPSGISEQRHARRLSIPHSPTITKPLYRNEGDANFTESVITSESARSLFRSLGWGEPFFGLRQRWLERSDDVNGHVYPQADKYNWGTSWKQRPMLFHNLQGKSFANVPAVEGSGLADVIAGRGMAVGDLFNDGRIDAVISVMDGHPILLNVNPDKNHWIELKLIGGAKSPRDAVGSTVFLIAGGIKQRQDVISGGKLSLLE